MDLVVYLRLDFINIEESIMFDEFLFIMQKIVLTTYLTLALSFLL